MTEDCPGYDRDRQVCLIRPGDCEFLPADGGAALMVDSPKGADAPALSRPQVSVPKRLGLVSWRRVRWSLAIAAVVVEVSAFVAWRSWLRRGP